MKKYSELATRVIAGLISLSTMVGAGAVICYAAQPQVSTSVEAEYEAASDLSEASCLMDPV